ncbi:MAG: TetR/AcrR family transcriptional regulator [Ectothiorhodospiraceae bacterium]|nr:TetR/AcrR family transcriptional regulator [Ectothiorhodospiraceae bacterium]MCH8505873.1 TetR/AcrR family transcriptional regulator [Ectothiorhodospiraceae bacterium]
MPSTADIERHSRALSDARRRHILEAAREVFQQRGLEGASMRLIARAAGCTTGAVYARFEGKEALYAEVLMGSLATLREALATALEGTSERRGATALYTFFHYYLRHPAELALGLYLYQGLEPGGLTPPLDRELNAALLEIYQTTAKAIADDGYDNAPEQATSGIAHAVGLLVLHRTRRLALIGGDAERQMQFYLEQVLP